MDNRTLAEALTSEFKELFWSKVSKGTACWTWTAALDHYGYGALRLNGATLKAHRVSYIMSGMDIPDGMILDHVCYNRSCVRPDHLRPATRKQNAENLSKLPAHNTSGVRGVYWHKQLGKWAVNVKSNQRKYSGGCYENLADAEQAAIRLRAKLFTHHKEFSDTAKVGLT